MRWLWLGLWQAYWVELRSGRGLCSAGKDKIVMPCGPYGPLNLNNQDFLVFAPAVTLWRKNFARLHSDQWGCVPSSAASGLQSCGDCSASELLKSRHTVGNETRDHYVMSYAHAAAEIRVLLYAMPSSR